jgi:hypothetical protein
VVTVTVTAVPAAELRETEGWLSEQLMLLGDPTTPHERFTVPLNPFVGVTKRVALPFPPATGIMAVDAVREKSERGLLSAVLSV